jgi:hypothetical protein
MITRNIKNSSGAQPRRWLWLPVLYFLLIPVLAQGQTTLSEWDFNAQVATPSTSIPANAAKTIGKGGGVGTILFTSVGGPNGSYAYATGWASGANSKYWVVNISTAGYGTLTLSSEQWSEYQFFQYQGPRNFKIQYSLNNSTWTDVPGGAYSLTTTDQGMKKGSVTNLAIPAACENQASVYFRWIMTDNTGANNSDPVSGGQNWIDNISIKGQSLSANTPPTISAIANQSTNEDVTFGPLTFTIGDAETAVGSLTVTATSSNTTLVPNANITLGGSTASRTITVVPAANASGTTTITVNVNDGTTSTPESFDLLVQAVNDAPVLANLESGALTFVEDGAPINVSSAITVSDVDDTNIESATVSITAGFVATEDVLSFTNASGITGSFAGSVLTLTGSSSLANYQAALRSVTYQNTNTILPGTAPRTLSFTVNDGSDASNTQTRTLTITPVNDAPVLANLESSALTFVEDGAPINVSSAITVSDVDDTNIESATVSITAGFVATEDVLSFTNASGITGSFAGSVLTLTGSSSLANYQAALRSVTYQNTNTILPGTAPRTLSFTVNDGSDASNTQTRTLSVIEVNDPPTAMAGPDQTLSCVLPTGIVVSVNGSASFDIENDKLSYAWAANGTPFATTSLASTNLAPGIHTVTLTVNDGRGGIDVDTLIVTLIPDTTPPVLKLPPNLTFNTNPGVCTFTDPGTAIGKATATDDCPHPITITSNAPGVYPKGATIVTWTARDASGNVSSGQQTITVLDKEAPMITSCPAAVTVEGDAQNKAQIPNLTWQLLATDNCTSPGSLTISQSPIGGSTVGAGVHTLTFTVVDGSGNQSTCTSSFTVVRRVEIDPVTPVTVISSACKQPVIVTRSVTIDNSGGNFGGGKLAWTATTTASEITLLTSSGFEGDDLLFTVDPRYLIGASHTRTITLTGYNSISMAPATNSPFTFTVTIQIEPQGTVSVSKAVGTNWTQFRNSEGHLIAEVKSNSSTINSFTVNVQPCTLPRVMQRIRYVRRTFTMTSSTSSPNVDVRLYYSNTEATPLISKTEALTMWHRPLNLYVDLGGASNVFANYVETAGITDLSGPFVLAHDWNPPVVTVQIQTAEWEEDKSTARLEWFGSEDLVDPVYLLERRPLKDPDAWVFVGDVQGDTGEKQTFTEMLPAGNYVYRILAADASGILTASQEIAIQAVRPATMTLDQNYPNPFNPTTTISFALTVAGEVQLTVHDMLGREIASLVDGFYDAGSHHVQFDASSLTGGVYSYTLRSGSTVLSRQMQLLK